MNRNLVTDIEASQVSLAEHDLNIYILIVSIRKCIGVIPSSTCTAPA